MPSITFWNHLEPSPLARTTERGLAAELRDPLWLLTRQWQFGEFRGEDAGSPAFVAVESDRAVLESWRAADGTLHALQGDRSIERQMLAEPIAGSDLLTRVELGQVFEDLLGRFVSERGLVGEDGLRARFRHAFALDPERVVAEFDRTRDTAEFLSLCAGRCVDGVALWQRLRGAPRAAPVAVDPADLAGVQRAQEAFLTWVREVFGELGDADPKTWVPEVLDHRGGLQSAPLAGQPLEFVVTPGSEGEIETYALDAMNTTVRVPERPSHTCHMMPGHLRVRGMPNARFWDFEQEAQDWGAIEAEPRDLARMVFLETTLTQGNDWFLMPLRVPVGVVCRVRALYVHDVFGVVTEVLRAGTVATSATRRWRMFTHDNGAREDLGWRVVMPDPHHASAVSPPVEEVRFVRDEMANLVWSIERVYADAFGVPVAARDALANRASDSATHATLVGSLPTGEPQLAYRLQTSVPAQYVPWITVRVTSSTGDVALELARVGTPAPPLRTRILRPSLGAPYHIPEWVIPREGVSVVQEYVRTRDPDGRSHLWLRRRRGAARGEVDAGLRYDVVDVERPSVDARTTAS
jgi:hypothetical protein